MCLLRKRVAGLFTVTHSTLYSTMKQRNLLTISLNLRLTVSFLENLKRRRSSKAVAFDKFARLNANTSNIVFIFVKCAIGCTFCDFQIHQYNRGIEHEYIYFSNRDG